MIILTQPTFNDLFFSGICRKKKCSDNFVGERTVTESSLKKGSIPFPSVYRNSRMAPTNQKKNINEHLRATLTREILTEVEETFNMVADPNGLM